MDEPIRVSTHSSAAFVGSALRGPLDTPVTIYSFADYKRVFGGNWQRGSLGFAVRQFFEHGGGKAHIVRVANGATGATIILRAGPDKMRLRALEPGSTEILRVAIDLDGIERQDSDRFNLTVQRLDPETGFVIDQEIHRRITCRPTDVDYIGDVLLESSLIRLDGAASHSRPDITTGPGIHAGSAYVGIDKRGQDGRPLTDYDVVGSARSGTGMFALSGVESFDLLYLPPPQVGIDFGPTAMLAAELYCRKRRAILIMDPPLAASSAQELISLYADSGYSSANVLAYFPRLRLKDSKNETKVAAGGAIAGLLCRLDRERGKWSGLDSANAEFQPGFDAAETIDEAGRQSLLRSGINVICKGRAKRFRIDGSVTLGAGSQIYSAFADLSVRRICLMILKNIERGTRWIVFEKNDRPMRERLRSQVHAYLTGLMDSGVLTENDVFVRCESDDSGGTGVDRHGVNILISFQPSGWGQPLSFTIHQSVPGAQTAATAFGPAKLRAGTSESEVA
jgi:hypothetical protein